MTLVTLAALISTITSTDALASMYQIASALGLTTTAWQPLGMANTILTTMSQVVASASAYVSAIAQGGYATTAALMIDANGNPITGWMDLVSYNGYGNTRNPAVPAEGLICFSNVTSTPYPYTPGALIIKNPSTGALYANTEQVSINGTFSSTAQQTLIEMAATPAWTGSLGTFVSGTPILVNPPAGVTVLALGAGGSAATLVGTDAETNAQLLTRDLAKLGAIAPNGAPGALEYVATTAPQNLGPIAAVITDIYGFPSAPVTRAYEQLAPFTGITTLYVANAAGGCSTGDAAIVQQLEQALAVPTDMTLVVVGATNQAILVEATIWVLGAAGSIAAEAAAAVVDMFSFIPIGGVTTYSSNLVPLSAFYSAINAVSPLIVEIEFGFPAGDVVIPNGSVPTLDGSSTFTVIVVPL